MYDIDQILINSNDHPSSRYNIDNTIKKKTAYKFTKRFIDIFLSIIIFLVLSPLILVSAFLIIIVDKHKPIYTSIRVGMNGSEFKFYKFQTMHKCNKPISEILSEKEYKHYKENFKIPNDPRVTKLGSFLRKTSIDELPQLINVIKGDMSLVGPRPVLQEETELYGVNRAFLLSVRPGLTGLWQASGRNNIDYASGKRQRIELYYIENRSLLMDIKILFMTIKAAITMNGAM